MSTGLSDLDELTGGLLPGALWVVTGPAGAGRTMFLLQLARHAAVHGRLRTHVVAGRDSARTALHYAVAGQVGIPLHRFRRDELTEDDERRLVLARHQFGSADLDISGRDSPGSVPSPDRLLADDRTEVLLIDDLDVYTSNVDQFSLESLKRHASSRLVSVVVTARQETVLGPDGLPQGDWGTHADLVMSLQLPGLDDISSVGDRQLAVLRHREGPRGVVAATLNAHHASFSNAGRPLDRA